MIADMDIEKAKEMIIEELDSLEEQDRKPKIKFKDIYQEHKDWSPIFFKAGKELDVLNEDLEMGIQWGYHHMEKIES